MLTDTELNWEHSEEWAYFSRGKHFNVSVVRNNHFRDQKNCWFVYAYIFPDHPLFKEFKDEDFDQPAADVLDLHCGCTFIRVTEQLVKVGCDYQHLWDDRFAEYKTKEQAMEVFKDAERLINQLNEIVNINEGKGE